ncbi:MAG TPA: hypothetical protein VH165_20710 [Kofleriaceae bacterium]|nr:hypothetical protein [Kofleriaceae bacterium]
MQYGDAADVKKRMRSIVKRLMRGENLIHVMTEGGMLDVAEHPGFLVLNGTVLSGAPHFHCGLPWMPLWQAFFDRRANVNAVLNEAIFEASLSVPWGVLGLLPYENHPWLIPETRFAPFIEAALRVWDELDAVGPRYSASVEGKHLWFVTNTLHFALANMGVPQDYLRAPIPAVGPRALLKYARVTN